jgi:hypothetical protein
MSINRKLGDLANVLDDGTEGQVLSFNASGKIAASTISTEGTLGTLTQSFDSNQTSSISLSSAANTVPFVSVFKEVPQIGISSKSSWDVNSNGANYDFYDEKPYSTYASSTLTPSATGDGTFTNSNAIVVGYQMSSTVSLNSTSPSIAGQGSGGSWQVVEFDPTGNHVYMVSGTTQSGYAKTVYQYTMSTPHDLSTLNTTPANTLDMSSKIVGTIAHYCPLHITNSGYDLYFGDYQNDIIYQWKMSTAYDLSTASYHGASSAIFVDTMASLFIQPNGLTGYQVQDGAAGSAVLREFTMTTAWDITTASLSGTTSSTLISRTQAVTISPDGTLVIASDAYGSTTSKYFTMSPGYDLSSLSSGTSFTWQGNSSHTTDTRFSSDGALLYGWSGTYIYNYTTGTTAAFNAVDVGKKVVGNSGSAVITGTSGTYKSVTPFADTSTISSWQLFGAQGKTDGTGITLSGYGNTYDLSNLSYDSKSYNASSDLPSAEGIAFKTDGTKMYLNGFNTASDQNTNQQIRQYSLSTAYDISTATYDNTYLNVSGQNTRQRDLRFKPDGTVLYMVGSTPDGVWQYNLSTAWDLSTASYSNKTINVGSQDTNPASLVLSADGTKVYIGGYHSKTLFQYNLSTAWDLSTASYSNNSFATVNDFNNAHESLELNSSGSKIFIGKGYLIAEYNMPSDGDVSNVSYVATYDVRNTTVGNKNIVGMSFANNGAKFYIFGNNDMHAYQFSAGSSVYAYSQYMPALTDSSSGQINSSTWLDINSMTADETKNDGDIFYAVSTDNRTSWSVAKGSDGVRKIARNNSGTWQYNNDGGSVVGYGLANETYDNKNFDTTADTSEEAEQGIAVSSDGTKFYITGYQEDKVFQFDMSTPFDLSTGAYNNVSYTLTGLTHPWGLFFKPDGTKMYVLNPQSTATISEYALSTAWDVSTASHTATENYSAGPTYESYGLFFKSDGSKVYILRYNSTIYSWNLTTPWDITTGSYIGVTSAFLNSNSGRDILFNDDGLKMYLLLYDGSPNTYYIREYDLSTAWDPSTASYNNISFQPGLDLGGSSTTITAMCWANSGKKLYVTKSKSSGGSNYGANSFTTTTTGFGTSETWVNGTNNNEHATLQEALGTQSFNRMNKAQLDAVADGYHFSQDSANTLDLMIAPYATSGTSPISDGVTINYNAASKYKQAIHGTEYDVEFTTTNSVDLTSKISANLKARVL